MGDDVAAWLLSYGAVSGAVIAIATLPLPHLTPPRKAGQGAPGGGYYRDVTGRGAAAAALRRLALDAAATGAARAGRRLGCAGTCDVGLEGVAAGRGWSRKVRKVELVLLHRSRAMDFAVGLLPFQDGTVRREAFPIPAFSRSLFKTNAAVHRHGRRRPLRW